MEDFIQNIYYYAQIIPCIKDFIKKVYEGKQFLANRLWDDLEGLLIDFCNETCKYDVTLGNQIFNLLDKLCKETQKSDKTYIQLADNLQEMMPLFYKAVSYLGNINVEDNGYKLVSSKSGFLSLEDANSGKLFCSLVDPVWEAHYRAIAIYNTRNTSFNFLGCGLGYLPWQVYCESDCSADIYIFHNKTNIVEYALNYGVLSWIPDNKLHIITEPDNLKLLEKYVGRDATKGSIGYVSMDDVVDTFLPEEIEVLKELDVHLNTELLYDKAATINTFHNIQKIKKMYTEYAPAKTGNDWIVVAGGPSVDDNLEYLKSALPTKNVICVMTILKKLLDEGIKPDLVAVLDTHIAAWEHVEDIEDKSVPMMIQEVANWRFCEQYEGDKYLVPGIACFEALYYYKEHGITPIPLGSSVSIMAIELALRFGAKQIELVGLDLGYPGDHTHAKGTRFNSPIDTSSLPKTESVDGKLVAQDISMKVFQRQAEEKIAQNPLVTFINRSSHGAAIKGARWYKD